MSVVCPPVDLDKVTLSVVPEIRGIMYLVPQGRGAWETKPE